MRRLPVLSVLAIGLLAAMAAALTSCTSDAGSAPHLSDDIFAPDSTAPAPGSCDPEDVQIPAPSIIIDGKAADATFGLGAYQCGTITGDGYIVNNFNPLLLDAGDAIKVDVNSDATAKIEWSLGSPFTETGDNVWTSAAPLTGCDRLTIKLKSPSGLSTATFGADIRVGGASVDCPQRSLDPFDPGADVGDTSVTLALGGNTPTIPPLPIGPPTENTSATTSG